MTLYHLLNRPAVFATSMALLLSACSGASSDEPTPAEGGGTPVENTNVGALADMSIGDENATVTVIEYASVTCPHCATFHETIFPTIKENYVDTGKIQFIFREFPTAPAELSVAGSMLARCAADKGGNDAYFLVIDSLFKTQGDPRARTGWIYSDSPRAELIKVAAQAGMDEDAFGACVRREELVDLINKNVTEGSNRYNVNSTPSFIINGDLRHFSNAEDFSDALDAALEKAAQ